MIFSVVYKHSKLIFFATYNLIYFQIFKKIVCKKFTIQPKIFFSIQPNKYCMHV